MVPDRAGPPGSLDETKQWNVSVVPMNCSSVIPLASRHSDSVSGNSGSPPVMLRRRLPIRARSSAAAIRR